MTNHSTETETPETPKPEDTESPKHETNPEQGHPEPAAEPRSQQSSNDNPKKANPKKAKSKKGSKQKRNRHRTRPQDPHTTTRGTPRKSPEERAHANRQNSQKSTGPKSPLGKARSSVNALRFQGASPLHLFSADDLGAFTENHRRQILAFRPVTQLERELVEKLARVEWKLKSLDSRENTSHVLLAIQQAKLNENEEMHLDPFRQLLHEHYFFFDPQSNPHNKGKLVLPNPLDFYSRYSGSLHRQYFKIYDAVTTSRRRRIDLIRKKMQADEEIDGFDAAASPALQALDQAPAPGEREVLAVKKEIYNLFTESDKVTDPYPQPYHKDYGFNWEASMFRGFVHDWAGHISPDSRTFTSYPVPRFTADHRERWPYCPDGSPREFRELNGHTTWGPRPGTGLPPTLPLNPDYGKKPNPDDQIETRAKKEEAERRRKSEEFRNGKKDGETKPSPPGKRY